MGRDVSAADVPDSVAVVFGTGVLIATTSAVASLAWPICGFGVVIGLILMAEGLRAAERVLDSN